MNKIFTAGLDIKSAAAGTIEAVFATLEVWDKDHDYTKKGAFGHQTNVYLEGWNHDRALPVGLGEIFERGNEAIFQGKFFLNTQAGRDHFEVVKQTRPEFSYTFDVLDSAPAPGGRGRILKSLSVMGVSPVTQGAGVATRLLSLKSGGRTWLPIGKTRAEIDAAIWQAEKRLMHLEENAIRANLAKNAPELTPEQMLEQVWLTCAIAQGYNPEYALTVLAARREQARQARLNARVYTPCYPAVRD